MESYNNFKDLKKCKFCGDNGFIDVAHRDSLYRKDAFGNTWPKIVNYVCWCESGQRKDQKFKRWGNEMSSKFKIFKYNETY